MDSTAQRPSGSPAAGGGVLLKPETPSQVAEAVRWAVAEEAPLELVSGGTKRALGRPVQASHTLDLSGLSGISLYEPEELVLTAAAGTPMAEIEAALAERHQQLAFEPADPGPLLGEPAGRQTIGGVLACNLSGPRRIKAGAARDHFLGFQAVSGHGTAFKAGGRVVKNVTGYDLSKLMAGAYGTLAAMTEVTVKVLPAPEAERTLVLLGLGEVEAVAVLALALQSPYEVAGAAHLPSWAAARSGVPELRGAGGPATLIRLEGFAASVAYRVGKLKQEFAARAAIRVLEGAESAAAWRELRDAAPFAGHPDKLVWKLSVPPSEGPRVVAAIAGAMPVDALYDWGGGLVWLGVDPQDGAGATAIRGALAATGGHATLIRAPEAVRAAVEVFQPQPAPLAALSARVKDTYDPRRVLNPGRMYAGV